MSFFQQFSKEFELEAQTTRKMLSIVPDDKYDWRPHPKSMTIRQLTSHIGELPSWIGMTLTTNELDFSANPYIPVFVNNTAELLDYFERTLEEARGFIDDKYENLLTENWTLRNGEAIYYQSPRMDFLRTTMSQIIHHRAQLGVYLRLLNIPIPGSYGPSADEGF